MRNLLILTYSNITATVIFQLFRIVRVYKRSFDSIESVMCIIFYFQNVFIVDKTEGLPLFLWDVGYTYSTRDFHHNGLQFNWD